MKNLVNLGLDSCGSPWPGQKSCLFVRRLTSAAYPEPHSSLSLLSIGFLVLHVFEFIQNFQYVPARKRDLSLARDHPLHLDYVI